MKSNNWRQWVEKQDARRVLEDLDKRGIELRVDPISGHVLAYAVPIEELQPRVFHNVQRHALQIAAALRHYKLFAPEWRDRMRARWL